MEDLQENSSTTQFLITSSSSLDPNPLSVDAELCMMAEERTQQILQTIQPVRVSERKRKEVFQYIRGLFNCYFGVEVFPFGSVPLKTYLPDGDIDLTAVSPKDMEEELVRGMHKLLEHEAQKPNSQVQNVRYIDAQVRIIKCSVQGILVDISFNQMAGLSALCFLEQVDALFGKDHLLKQSIILIKAWGFYEGRIHGANFGLLSTYALEILVLYIINRFHSSLCGPLAVLYKFLEYYSTFDWAKYCVTINGRVALSSLREHRGETTENDGEGLFLSQELLRQCTELYSIPAKALETRYYGFQIRFLNIVDPLKDNNNVGRSITKGNCLRLRFAFAQSFRRLQNILLLPAERLCLELENFFGSTLGLNGRGQRDDVTVSVPLFGTGGYELLDLSGDFATGYYGLLYGGLYHNYTLPIAPQFSISPPSSEGCNRSAPDTLHQLLRGNRDIFYQIGTDVLFPRVLFSQPYFPQLSLNLIVEGERSRGTGTYIPDMTNVSYRSRYEPGRARNREFMFRGEAGRGRNRDYITRNEAGRVRNRDCITQDEQGRARYRDFTSRDEPGRVRNRASPSLVLSPKSSGSMAEVEDRQAKDNVEDGCSLDLSLESFPLLPVIKKDSSLEFDRKFDTSAVTSTESRDCSFPLSCIKFGKFKITDDSGASAALNSLPGSPNIVEQKQQEFLETGEQKVVPKPFQLKDANDFPPLS